MRPWYEGVGARGVGADGVAPVQGVGVGAVRHGEGGGVPGQAREQRGEARGKGQGLVAVPSALNKVFVIDVHGRAEGGEAKTSFSPAAAR